jgi:hypothetical protein
METIPSIGGARGVFEIFVPGVFLLVNIAGAIYLLPSSDDSTRKQIAAVAASPALALLVAIPFGFLAGVVLRLLRTDVPDRTSALFLRFYDSNARGDPRKENQYAHERFPYTGWLETVVDSGKGFPPTVRDFFSSVWKDQNSKSFLNFCKVIVSAEDPAAGAEIYSAESFSRYISGMFYALAAAFGILVLLAISRLVAGVGLGVVVPVAAVTYLAGLVAILANFRFIRIKEVETIFAAAFKNRHLFSSAEDAANVEPKRDNRGNPAGR